VYHVGFTILVVIVVVLVVLAVVVIVVVVIVVAVEKSKQRMRHCGSATGGPRARQQRNPGSVSRRQELSLQSDVAAHTAHRPPPPVQQVLRVERSDRGVKMTTCYFLMPRLQNECSYASTTTCLNPLTPNDLQRRGAVSPLKIKIPSKNMREKPTNATIIRSVYQLCMVAPTCFGITISSSGSVRSAF
jgi:hypothetical protein